MIPQVNAGATDGNRKQTERICELLGYQYSVRCHYWVTKNERLHEQLQKGSFTLDQVAGMLEAEGAYWGVMPAGWYLEGRKLCGSDSPHDLTAAMDTLIKVLETKGEKA